MVNRSAQECVIINFDSKLSALGDKVKSVCNYIWFSPISTDNFSAKLSNKIYNTIFNKSVLS